MGIRKNFAKDVVYSGISKYSTIIIALIVTAVLSRILTPDDFGVVAIATVFIAFFNLLSDFGIAAAIVQFKDLTRKDISNIFGWSFWLAVLLSTAFFFCSSIIGSFYANPLLIPICRFLSLQIFFATLNIVPNALLLKNKKFNVIAIRTLTIQILCGIASVIAALNGVGVYALLINPIVGIFINLVINVVYMKMTINLLPAFSSLKKIFSFSIFQFLFNFINYIGNNVDKMIISKAISISGLGYYEKAYRLGQMPAQTINGVIGPVLHPYLSDYQTQPEKLLNVYDKMNRVLLTLSFPVSAFCLLCSRELVLIVFGPQWIESIVYFAIISITITTHLASSPTGAFLQASNKTKLLFYLGVVNTCLSIICLSIGAFVIGSIKGICFMGIISSIMGFINTYIATYGVCFKKSPMPVFKYVIRPLVYFLIVGLGGYLFFSKIEEFPLILSLLVKTIVWGVATFIFVQFFTPFKPTEYYNLIMSKIRNR